MIYNTLNRIFGYPLDDNSPVQLKYNCPRCRDENFGIVDNKYNLEINLNFNGTDKKVCNCWKCGLSGPLYYIVRKYGSNDDVNEFLKYEKDSVILKNIKKNKVWNLPKEFISFADMDMNNPEHLEAYNYVKNDRIVSDYIIKRDKLGFCLDGYYKKSIIIPSYDINNKLNFFATRSYEAGGKWKLCNADKKEIIFNEKNINWNSTVYIVEAYFEYTTIPFNTIVLLGKSLFDIIIEKLLFYKPKVVICLNPDAVNIRDDFNYKKKPNSILEIHKRLIDLGYSDLDVKYLSYNNDYDLNKNHKLYGKEYIFNLLKKIGK